MKPPLHKVVSLVLPLPDPSKPEQHEACCPLGTKYDLYRYLVYKKKLITYASNYKLKKNGSDTERYILVWLFFAI